MEYRITTHRKAAGIALVYALAVLILAMPAGAQSPVTLAGGGAVVSFPSTSVAQSSSVSVTLNVNAAFQLTALSTSGDFAVSNTNCNVPISLKPGDSCILEIAFSPSAAGPRWSPLVLTDDKGGHFSFGFVGSGVGPTLTFVPGIAGTVAGTGGSGYSGDGGPGTAAQLSLPMGIARDNQGNLYVADTSNNVVRKLDANGTISTVAGNGSQGYSGDGGPASGAQLAVPTAVALDSAGNLYIADFLNFCVRKVDINGTISTLAAPQNFVRGVTVDTVGNVYFSGWPEGVWKIDSQGVTTKIAGNGQPGFSGDGGLATDAQMFGVAGIGVDSQGNIYAAEVINSDVRKIDTKGIISTVAGNHQPGFSGDGGPATDAQFNSPMDVRFDAADNLYIADSGNNRIRKVSVSGTISSVAGDGNFAYAGDGGSAAAAQFAGPAAITLDGRGNLFIADSGNNAIRRVQVDSSVIDFGTVTVGLTGGPIGVIVANAGNADLKVQGVVPKTDFGAQTTCPSDTGVKAGDECQVDVSFTPTANANVTSTVVVNDDAAGNPHSINVKGNGYILPRATDLVIVGQYDVLPLNANLGVVEVDAMDANGHLVTDFNGAISLDVQGPLGFTPYTGQVNALGGIASFDLTGLILNVAGSYSIVVSSPGLSSMQVTFDVAGSPDFGITTSQQSLTVSGAGSGSLNVTVTPMNGFTGNITLSCSALPAYAVCSFAPSTLGASGNDAAMTSELTIRTGVTEAAVVSKNQSFSLAATTGTFGIGLVGMTLMTVLRRNQRMQKRVRAIQIAWALIILMGGLVGCGGRLAEGGGHRTSSGSYTVTVTATSSGRSHSSAFTLVVQ